MDGWRTDAPLRRPDWCIVRIEFAAPCAASSSHELFAATTLSTAPSMGAASTLPPGCDRPHAQWRELVPKTALQGDARNEIAVNSDTPAPSPAQHFSGWRRSRLRFTARSSPIGRRRARGDSRSRGEGERRWSWCAATCSSAPTESHPSGRRPHGDGGDARRADRGTTGPCQARPNRVDPPRGDRTDHFKGKRRRMLDVLVSRARGVGRALGSPTAEWRRDVAAHRSSAHARHRFERELRAAELATHVRLDIYPDGGVARLRVFGRPGATT